jgi:3-hydroxybutyryl-CoA dehydrogenase
MSGWLYLGPDQKDPWMKSVIEKNPAVMWLDRIPTSNDLKFKELVVEAFPEGDLKGEMLKALSQCKEWKGPVASLIERSSATYWAAQSKLEERLIGFRLCPSSDAPHSVELLRGEITKDEVLRVVQEALRELGFLVFICKDQAGGILPRVLAAMINEAAYMVFYGIATVEEIDRMMRLGANFPMGPFEWADRMGLDHIITILEVMSQELGPHYNPCPWIRRKVEAGQVGVKTGRGFYQHSAGGTL